jgi:hypothetical protein
MKKELNAKNIFKIIVLGTALYDSIIVYELINHFWIGFTWLVVQTITITALSSHWIKNAPLIK